MGLSVGCDGRLCRCVVVGDRMMENELLSSYDLWWRPCRLWRHQDGAGWGDGGCIADSVHGWHGHVGIVGCS